MTKLTTEARAKLEQYLSTHDLPKGLGNEESACSIAAINIAITGELTDNIPDCMSYVVGLATIVLQDAMPDDMRNSARYKNWLPNAAGTGREREQQRLAVLMDWMWGTVLPELQGLADARGFGDEWRKMCELPTKEAADAARDAANAAADAADAVAYAAYAAARAANAAADAVYAAADAVYAAADAVYAADAAYAAARAANAAYSADAAKAGFWQRVDPIGVLERMTYLEEGK